jgi:hypothetical protein
MPGNAGLLFCSQLGLLERSVFSHSPSAAGGWINVRCPTRGTNKNNLASSQIVFI